MKGKPGRHVPAFVLLILAKKPAYGLQILNQLKEEMPYCRLDSAAIYRALNQLEDSGAIQVFEQSNDEESSLDLALFKKYYSITDLGLEELKTFYCDIEKRHANLSYFISTYSHLRKDQYDK